MSSPTMTPEQLLDRAYRPFQIRIFIATWLSYHFRPK